MPHGGTQLDSAQTADRPQGQVGGGETVVIDKRPQQDSNLRTRLRSGLPKIALTCMNPAFHTI
jgi:hypothetical protein